MNVSMLLWRMPTARRNNHWLKVTFELDDAIYRKAEEMLAEWADLRPIKGPLLKPS